MTQPFWVLRNMEWLFPHLPPTPGHTQQECVSTVLPPKKTKRGQDWVESQQPDACVIILQLPVGLSFWPSVLFYLCVCDLKQKQAAGSGAECQILFFLCPQQRIHVFNWSLLSPREIYSKQNVQTALAQWSNRVVFLWQPWSQVMGSNSCLSNYFM